MSAPGDVTRRCAGFLRAMADVLDRGERLSPTAGDDDPVGVLVMLEAGPALYVPTEYVKATARMLENNGIKVVGYSQSDALDAPNAPNAPIHAATNGVNGANGAKHEASGSNGVSGAGRGAREGKKKGGLAS